MTGEAALDLSPIVLAHEKPFVIDGLQVRPPTRELCFGEMTQVLEPRVMQLLIALHRAGGDVVNKDDLIQLCWNGRIVGEDAINRVVSHLRQALASIADGAVAVETITKVGYRLKSNAGAHAKAPAQPKPFDRRGLLVAGGALGAVALGTFAWVRSRDDKPSPEAAAFIQLGRTALSASTIEQTTSAATYFRRATELEPRSAEAWGALALAYRLQSKLAPGSQAGQLSLRAGYASRRALALDPNNSDAVAADVMAVPRRGNWLDYERNCRRALERFPDHSRVNLALAQCLADVGRNREALGYVERALRAEPRAPIHHMHYVSMLWDLGRLDEADTAIETAFRLWPRHYAIWFARYYYFAFTGRAGQALAMIDGPDRPFGIPKWNFDVTRLQAVAMQSRRPSDIATALSASLEVARRGAGFAESAVLFAGAVAAVDAAYQVVDAYFFGRGFSVGETRFSEEQGTYTPIDTRFTYFLFRVLTASLRADARFTPLTQALGLSDYWTKSGTQPDYRAGAARPHA